MSDYLDEYSRAIQELDSILKSFTPEEKLILKQIRKKRMDCNKIILQRFLYQWYMRPYHTLN